jgi:hypothetical protein
MAFLLPVISAELKLGGRRNHLEHLATAAGKIGPVGLAAQAYVATCLNMGDQCLAG